jgi:hypothetical protein
MRGLEVGWEFCLKLRFSYVRKSDFHAEKSAIFVCDSIRDLFCPFDWCDIMIIRCDIMIIVIFILCDLWIMVVSGKPSLHLLGVISWYII